MPNSQTAGGDPRAATIANGIERNSLATSPRNGWGAEGVASARAPSRVSSASGVQPTAASTMSPSRCDAKMAPAPRRLSDGVNAWEYLRENLQCETTEEPQKHVRPSSSASSASRRLSDSTGVAGRAPTSRDWTASAVLDEFGFDDAAVEGQGLSEDLHGLPAQRESSRTATPTALLPAQENDSTTVEFSQVFGVDTIARGHGVLGSGNGRDNEDAASSSDGSGSSGEDSGSGDGDDDDDDDDAECSEECEESECESGTSVDDSRDEDSGRGQSAARGAGGSFYEISTTSIITGVPDGSASASGGARQPSSRGGGLRRGSALINQTSLYDAFHHGRRLSHNDLTAETGSDRKACGPEQSVSRTRGPSDSMGNSSTWHYLASVSAAGTVNTSNNSPMKGPQAAVPAPSARTNSQSSGSLHHIVKRGSAESTSQNASAFSAWRGGCATSLIMSVTVRDQAVGAANGDAAANATSKEEEDQQRQQQQHVQKRSRRPSETGVVGGQPMRVSSLGRLRNAVIPRNRHSVDADVGSAAAADEPSLSPGNQTAPGQLPQEKQKIPVFTSTEHGVISPNGQHVKSTIASRTTSSSSAATGKSPVPELYAVSSNVNSVAAMQALLQQPDVAALQAFQRTVSLNSGEILRNGGPLDSLDDDSREFLAGQQQLPPAVSLTLTSDPMILTRFPSQQGGGNGGAVGTTAVRENGRLAFKLLSFKKQDDGPVPVEQKKSSKKKKDKKHHRSDKEKRERRERKEKEAAAAEGHPKAAGSGAGDGVADRPTTVKAAYTSHEEHKPSGEDGREAAAIPTARKTSTASRATSKPTAGAAGGGATENANHEQSGGPDLHRQSSFFKTDEVKSPSPNEKKPIVEPKPTLRSASVNKQASRTPSTTRTKPTSSAPTSRAAAPPPAAKQSAVRRPQPRRLPAGPPTALAARNPVAGRTQPPVQGPPPARVEKVDIQGPDGSISNLKLPTYSTTATLRRVTVTPSHPLTSSRGDQHHQQPQRQSAKPPPLPSSSGGGSTAGTNVAKPNKAAPAAAAQPSPPSASPPADPQVAQQPSEETPPATLPVAANNREEDKGTEGKSGDAGGGRYGSYRKTDPSGRGALGRRLTPRESAHVMIRRRSSRSIVKLIDSADEKLPPL